MPRPFETERRSAAPEAQPAPPPPEPSPPEPRAAAPERQTETWPDEGFRPIVRGETAVQTETSAAPAPAWGEPVHAAEPARGRETFAEDIPIAIVSLALAASAFLPWYEGPPGFDVTVTAWKSGTWGPIIFFLGIGSFLLVLLRRVGVRLSLPFEEALLHEFAGWVALAGGVIKSRYRPGAEGLLGVSWGLWVGLGAAFLLAFLAGRMAPHAPLVRRPKWYRERGGALAAVILLAVVAGAAVFGTVNKTGSIAATFDPPELPGVVQGRLPDCADDLPVPSGMRPVQGVEQPCRADFQSERPPAEVVTAWRQAFVQAGWTVVVGEAGGTTTFNITAPKCATAAVLGADQGSVAVVAFGICATGTPSTG